MTSHRPAPTRILSALSVLVLWLALCAAAPAASQSAAAPAFPTPAASGAYLDQREIPDTPAWRRAQEIVELLNAGDQARVKSYLETKFAPAFLSRWPLADHLRIFRELGERSNGYEVYGARSYEPPRPQTSATLIVRNRLTEGWEAIVLEVEEDAPHRIARLRVAPARVPSDLPPEAPLSDRAVARRLGALVDRLAAADVFSGTVLLARNGRVLLEKAVGLANRDFRAPVTADTKFNLGSMNKMFTAVAVARLVEDGKLSFDDPIGKFLDEDWLPRDILDRVTVHHLLTHTSGLGSYFNETFMRSSRALYRRVEDYRPLVQGDTLRFAPGSGWAYSNTGFLLLGAVIEKASGQDYFDFIRQHVTGPAGMKRTDCYELDRENENLAVGYEKEYGPAGTFYRNNLFTHVIRGGPAGGGYSTARDLLAFDRALRRGTLLEPETLARLWTPEEASGDGGYGYGFGIFETAAGKAVGHSGGFDGINSELLMYLDSGWTVAVMSNRGQGAAPVVQRARNLIERR